MKLEIDRASSVPIRQQIVRQVVFEIATGRLAAGTTLPSVRELAQRHKVHANTVSQAYRELVREHWIHGQRGRRMVVRSATDPLGPADEDLDDLINQTIRMARERGYDMQALRQRVRERLLLEPPDHVLVAEREAGLVRILTSELEAQLSCAVEGCLPAELEASPGNAISALLTCLPGMVWRVGRLVGRHRTVLTLQLPDADEMKAMVRNLDRPSLVVFVSISPYCLSTAEGLFAGVTGSRHTMEHYCLGPNERRDLRGADLVIADPVAARSVRATRLVPYRFVSRDTVESIGSIIPGAGSGGRRQVRTERGPATDSD
jgi:DNA-binding transcriptional regulator YhcF (GntR family)